MTTYCCELIVQSIILLFAKSGKSHPLLMHRTQNIRCNKDKTVRCFISTKIIIFIAEKW